jgi:uroporphyrin-III C-methyltransferase
MSERGKVYLVGAGPGDIELLTIKATRCLAQADVVLLDDLANPEVLQFVRQEADVIRVGKRGGCKSTPQEQIEQRMRELAYAGKTVARVKGGDPFVFGRGGEEMQSLLAAGVEVEVVNGITAGIAVPAAVGIPLTHRDFVQGAIFVTGHARPGNEPNWQALAGAGMTLVIYMGVANLAHITEQLLAGGMPGETPAAAIQHGTLPMQRHVVATLATLAQAINDNDIGSPAIIILGGVVHLARTALPGAACTRAPLTTSKERA